MLLCPNRYETDLLNEVLNIDFGQEAAKISEVKVGGQRKYRHPYYINTIEIGLL